MKKILLISLGGTIACVRTKKGLMPKLKAKDLVRYVSLPRGVIVDSVDFLTRTILFPSDWVLLSRKIFTEYDKYDGFVVTLGTDTLAFVASALSLMLRGLSKPVVLTGAMKIMRSRHSDGGRNLGDAIRVAAQEGIGGVLVVFNGSILDGRTVSKVHSDANNAFESINSPALGKMFLRRIQWRNKPLRRKAKLRLSARLDTRVVTARLTPQLEAGFLGSLASYHGIIIEGYGDGNVPSGLVPVILGLAKKSIVLLGSQCLYGRPQHQYEGGAALIKNGVLSSQSMTREMACVKLMWALGQSKDRCIVRRIMKDSWL